MIRFSAALVVVAVGVLIGGIATSTLVLVYVAIALSAAALIALAIGVALKRDELFGDAEPRFPVGGAAGAAAGQSAFTGQPGPGYGPGQAYAGQQAAGPGWSRPSAQGAAPAYEGTGWTPPRGPGGDAGETRRDVPPPGAGAPHVNIPLADETRTDIPPIDATRTDIPPYSAQSPAAAPKAEPPADATRTDVPRTEAPRTDAPRADAPRAAARREVTETRADMTAIGKDAPTTNDPRSVPGVDETRMDLPPTPAGPSAPSRAPGAPAPGAPGPASGSGSGTRQVAVVPGVPRYHALNCILVRFMDEGDLEKMTQDEANAAGYTPCAACQADTGSFKVAD